jgi:hypothetical protein
MSTKIKRHTRLLCHSGLSGIILCFQKDSRLAALAGMTTYEALLMHSLVYLYAMGEAKMKQTMKLGPVIKEVIN